MHLPITPLVLAFLFLFGLSARSASGSPPGRALNAESPPRDTVVVFVAWGSSNSCNPGIPGWGSPPNQQPASPTVSSNVAVEWFAWGTSSADVRTLASPVPCRSQTGVSGTGGSWWPQIALTYHEATDRRVFFSSAAEGASAERWMPPSGRNYSEGLTAIEDAMDEARRYYRQNRYTVVFGGVVWNLGPGLAPGDTYPYGAYEANLRTLLTEVSSDVVDRWGGRFYFVNTAIPGTQPYPDVEMDGLLDTEAAVCGEFAFCSMIRESAFVKRAQLGCMGEPGASDLCGGWYSISNQTGRAEKHWGQTALNHIGQRIAEAMIASGPVGRSVGAAASGTAPAALGAALLDSGEVRPNPATTEVTVPFTLSADAAVEAALYDVLGRRVAVLGSATYGAGPHALRLATTGLPPGVFTVHITARGASGSSTAARRVTVAR